MAESIVVTMCDEGYYPLACDLISSIRSFIGLANIPIGIIDCGLSDEQRRSLSDESIAVVRAEWNYRFPMPAGLQRRALAMLARPFIPEYFPRYDTIMYLDADTWLQHPSGVTDLLDNASIADVSVIPELHPAYEHLYSDDNPIRGQHRWTYSEVYGRSQGVPGTSAVLNSGVFSTMRSSPVWEKWQNKLGSVLESRAKRPGGTRKIAIVAKTAQEKLFPFGARTRPSLAVLAPGKQNFFAEQNALNAVALAKEIKVNPVSPLYNWVCTLAMPRLDPRSGLLVEPTLPFSPIKIVHLTGEGRKVKSLQSLDGRVHARGLLWREQQAAA